MAPTPSVVNGSLAYKSRISSIDIMRGIVMVIMALDHTRDFFHTASIAGNDPTNMATTSPAFFFTRWITHFCAPTFVLLSGVAIRINTERKAKKDLFFFLITRGLWLILLEIVVIRFSFFFNFYYDVTFFQVIWVIGASMVVLSVLIFLPARIVFALGLILVLGHNFFDYHRLAPTDTGYAPWVILRQSGFLQLFDSIGLIVAYPLLPWLGIMCAGYGIGEWYTSSFNPNKRFNLLLYSGAGVVLLFLILRSINLYGDPAPWSVQEGKSFLYTVMSFLNTTKYPPSLLYILMTLGPVLFILAIMDVVQSKKLTPFIIYGRVPLFYYVLHFYLIHITSFVLMLIMTGKSISEVDLHISSGFGGIAPPFGLPLPLVYLVWALIVLALYPLCKWYNGYKSTHRQWWLSYI